MFQSWGHKHAYYANVCHEHRRTGLTGTSADAELHHVGVHNASILEGRALMFKLNPGQAAN
jgi:hypothetical protein